eukprot:TRINITY_DN7681_c0_g1_i1.p1 TRINITY_DN7681_c0_g1~~TRINITY_DN7681_c0_g1_i1.p1  ORF type:complete len:289 (+),score=37.90 TRINITY_DN7681_c0_g1_i1:132-998(+)
MDVVSDYFNTKIQESFLEDYLVTVGLHYDNPIRVFSVIWLILVVFSIIGYFSLCSISYFVIYKLYPHTLEDIDKAIKPGQIKREIKVSLSGVPVIATLTAPIYVLHWAGFGQLYYDITEYSAAYIIFNAIWFILFTDCLIYWIHWGLHLEPFYTYLHKTHHSFLCPTPWAAIAFHPVDGYLQSTPYHLFTFIFPMNNWVYLGMFVFVQIWTISIHDRLSMTKLDGVINGSAHHAGHHYYYRYNYGQYFTLWDRLNNTHRPWDFPKGRSAATGYKSNKENTEQQSKKLK